MKDPSEFTLDEIADVESRFAEIVSQLRTSEGNKELDYALDAMDEGATRATYRIDNYPGMSERLKVYCSWMEGIYYHFKIAEVYLEYNRPIQARAAISESEKCMLEGSEICRRNFERTLGEELSFAMNFYYQSLFENINR